MPERFMRGIEALNGIVWGPMGLGLLFGTGLLLTVLLIGIGAFGYFLMSSLVGAFLPVELEKMGASNTFIGIFITSIPYVLNMIITPVVSFQSDRLRTRLGRRMPYILCSAPFVTLFLILIGWTPAFCAGAVGRSQFIEKQ